MALRECPDCKKQVSDLAAACINCGYPLARDLPVLPGLVEELAPQRPKSRASVYRVEQERKAAQDRMDAIAARKAAGKRGSGCLMVLIGLVGLAVVGELGGFIGPKSAIGDLLMSCYELGYSKRSALAGGVSLGGGATMGENDASTIIQLGFLVEFRQRIDQESAGWSESDKRKFMGWLNSMYTSGDRDARSGRPRDGRRALTLLQR